MMLETRMSALIQEKIGAARVAAQLQGRRAIELLEESAGLAPQALTAALAEALSCEAIALDGLIPEDGARTALRAMASFDPTVKVDRIAIAKTYTNEFARRAKVNFKA